MSAVAGREALETALSAAVRASLPLPQTDRPAFISTYLLAQLENATLPVAAGERSGKPAELQAELAVLSDLLTGVVNAARGQPGWPIKAVAAGLANAKIPTAAATATAAAAVGTSAAATAAAEEEASAKEKAKAMAAKAIATSELEVVVPQPSAADLDAPTPSKGVSFGDIPSATSSPNIGSPDRAFTDSFGGLTRLGSTFYMEGVDDDPNADPFRVSMSTGIIRRKSFKQSIPQEKFDAVVELRETDELEHVREVARLAFEMYDKDNSGTIDKEELFLALMELGRVAPSNYGDTAKIDYLEANFALADTNGDGEVDFDEFVEFYASTLHAVKQEDVARDAFSRYDVDGSNTLEKHELFQALLDLDMVPGFDLAQKRTYLEEQFAAADSNGDGVVDFSEFVAFYVTAQDSSKNSEVVQKRRQRAEKQRLDRLKRQAAYVDAGAIFTAAKSDEVLLVRGKWLLERAGYVMGEKERKGRKVYSWTLPEKKKDEAPAPLPCRQELVRDVPAAVMPVDELEGYHAKFLETLANTKNASKVEGILGVPVVLASHVWETNEHPDPSGKTLRRLAAALATQLPTYQAWGMDDVGVMLDWCSLYQETATEKRTPHQVTLFNRAKNQMCVWFAHQQTTVYLAADPAVAAPDGTTTPGARDNRGWPFFEEAACRLFKNTPPDRPFKLPHGALVPAWHKVIDAAAKDRSDEKKRQPPLSAPHFATALSKGTLKEDLTRESPKQFSDALDAKIVSRLYRRCIEDGYDGLDKLNYSRLEWGDSQLSELSATLDEVACSHVLELDLSYSDFSTKGMDALAHAISLGALSSLKILNLSHCTAVRSLPEAIGKELHELQVLNLEGCVGLKSLSKSLSTCACLKQLYVHCCHGLTEADFKALPASVEVISTPYVAPPVLAPEAATPQGTPRQ